MHVVVHTIPVKPGAFEQAKAFFEAKVPPLAERFSGWRGARLLATNDNHLVTIGMWADEAQMQQFLGQPAFGEAMASFSELFAGPPRTFITRQLTAVGPAVS
jgi:quinol monooxygenase YgiN